MNQLQFDTIMKVIRNGAPALAEELCGCIITLVEDNKSLANQVRELTDAQKLKCDDCECGKEEK